MVKYKTKHCEKCKTSTTHEYVGKEMYSLLPLWFYKYWKCCECGKMHKEDTAWNSTEFN